MRLAPGFVRALLPVGLAAASCAALGQAALPATIAVPTEAQLAAFPRLTSFQLSPDGKHIAALESRGDARQVLVLATDNLSAKPRVFASSAMRIDAYSWAKKDVLALTLTQPFDLRASGTLDKLFIRKLMLAEFDGKEWREPLAGGEIARSDDARLIKALALPSIKSRMPADPDHVIIESGDPASARDLFRYNVRTGATTRVLRLSEADGNVLVDSKGEPRAKTRGGSDSKGYYIATDVRNKTSGEWDEHFRSYVKDRDIVDVVSPGLTSDTMVLRSNRGREQAALYEYDAAKRQVGPVLFEHRFFPAVGVVRATGSSDVTEPYRGFSFDGLYGTEVFWNDPKFESVVEGIAQALGIGKTKVTMIDTADGTRADVQTFDGVAIRIVDYLLEPEPVYVVRVSGLAYPTEHYLLRGQKLSLLGRERGEIDRRALGSSRLVYYSARDGLQIPAILTVPNAQLCGQGPHAAVVHPHGGPWARDDMLYDESAWVPLMVSRCRVVLQPQFRGSAGWGRTLWKAGDAEWGQKMQDDKDDGARWLAAEKLADPRRVAMFGYSYGGYAAMAAAVRPNGLYKCAVAGAGVSDIDKIWARFYNNAYFREGQAPTVKGLSPARVADKLSIPMLVFHGDRDQTVPIEQSVEFVDRARASKQKVDYFAQPDAAHGPMWKRAEKERELKALADYFATGCGGGGL
jgi:dipeptidyl aminopeptidase/acylaminoacyl peptidase